MVKALAQVALAAGFDRIVGAVALGRSERSRRASRAESLSHAERMEALRAIAARHDAPAWRAPPHVFFDAGRAEPWERLARKVEADREIWDVRWRSEYAPLGDEASLRQRLASRPENGWAHARLWLHSDRPRPTAILLHGYLGGSYAVEERAWPVRWMFEKLGLDLAIPVLPHHGPRSPAFKRPMFPSSDPRVTIEGFRQAIWELMVLRARLAERGSPAVGVMGMSLGGYTSALALTADPNLAFGVPFIPLASIADFARDAGRLVGLPAQRREQHAALERAHAPVSPLARELVVDPDRILVVAGRGDRITPMSHAQRLAERFGAPLHTFDGGHLLQLGRADGFREVARLLRDRGLLER
ncbi:MAG: alpha/beta hydrolase [Sandaracinaceae bacterium]